MKLEVGKSYRTRDGEKVTIIINTKDDSYPVKGDNGQWYELDGENIAFNHNDLISEWVEPAKFKEGDVVEVKLTERCAKLLNEGWSGDISKAQIISHTPAPEPEFDWATVKAGMAFLDIREPSKMFWYLNTYPHDNNFALFGTELQDGRESINATIYIKSGLTRSPENDIEV